MTAYLSNKVYKEGDASNRSFQKSKMEEKNQTVVLNSIFLDHFNAPMQGTEYEEKLKSLLRHKQDIQDRVRCRSLEKDILKHKSKQALSPQRRENVLNAQFDDPAQFDLMAMRQKFSELNKDPTVPSQDISKYWSTLNQLPRKGVKKVITDKILEYDKQSCQAILKKMIRDVERDTAIKETQQIKREGLRSKLAERHNKTFDFESKIGIKRPKKMQKDGFKVLNDLLKKTEEKGTNVLEDEKFVQEFLALQDQMNQKSRYRNQGNLLDETKSLINEYEQTSNYKKLSSLANVNSFIQERDNETAPNMDYPQNGLNFVFRPSPRVEPESRKRTANTQIRSGQKKQPFALKRGDTQIEQNHSPNSLARSASKGQQVDLQNDSKISLSKVAQLSKNPGENSQATMQFDSVRVLEGNKNPLPQKDNTQRSKIEPSFQDYSDENLHMTRGSGLKMRVAKPISYKNKNQRINEIAVEKKEFANPDFFMKQEFRGLIMADHQEAVGRKAMKHIEELNKSCNMTFKTLASLQDMQNSRRNDTMVQDPRSTQARQFFGTTMSSFGRGGSRLRKNIAQRNELNSTLTRDVDPLQETSKETTSLTRNNFPQVDLDLGQWGSNRKGSHIAQTQAFPSPFKTQHQQRQIRKKAFEEKAEMVKQAAEMDKFEETYCRAKSLNNYPRSELHKMQRFHTRQSILNDTSMRTEKADTFGEIMIA